MRVPHASRTLRCVGFVTTRPYPGYVWSARKHLEKLRYMRQNPVKRGLVELPEQWKWSSFQAYRYGETRPVRVKFQEWRWKSGVVRSRVLRQSRAHSFAKCANEWGTRIVSGTRPIY